MIVTISSMEASSTVVLSLTFDRSMTREETFTRSSIDIHSFTNCSTCIHVPDSIDLLLELRNATFTRSNKAIESVAMMNITDTRFVNNFIAMDITSSPGVNIS